MFLALKQILFGSADDTKSKELARSRLHFVLVQDRSGLSSDEMAKFKEEMVSVIEKYFMIDKNGFDIAYKRDQDTTTLLINSPVVVKRSGKKKDLKLAKDREKDREKVEEESPDAPEATV